jgi:hypothetical protein
VRDQVARMGALGLSDDEILLIAEGVKWEGYSIDETSMKFYSLCPRQRL